MSPELKFVLFQLVIIIPFLTGSYLNHRFSNLESLARRIVLFNLTLLEPPIILWSILGLSMSPEMVFLPLSGLLLATTGFMVGKGMVRGIRLQEKSAKVYVICSSLANQGFTMGGFLCYLFAGEQGLALSGIFMIFYIPFTFLFIFAYAGSEGRDHFIRWSSVKGFLLTPRNMPLLAILTAIAIRIVGIRRPDVYFPLEFVLIIAIALYYFTLGINFKISDLNPFKKEHFFLAVQKFGLLPVLAFTLVHVLPISEEMKLIIKIESFMPVAVYAVISSIIFNLDSRKASGMFVVNSLVFILVIFPILYFSRSFLI